MPLARRFVVQTTRSVAIESSSDDLPVECPRRVHYIVRSFRGTDADSFSPSPHMSCPKWEKGPISCPRSRGKRPESDDCRQNGCLRTTSSRRPHRARDRCHGHLLGGALAGAEPAEGLDAYQDRRGRYIAVGCHRGSGNENLGALEKFYSALIWIRKYLESQLNGSCVDGHELGPANW
jgi:hypothetical protein